MSAIDRTAPGEKIAWVTVTINTPDLFYARVTLLAEELDAICLPLLPGFFPHPPTLPAEERSQFSGLGQWMSVCQAAIFAMLYSFREAALPFLRQAAFGVYDWTQARAMEVLCEGLERERSVSYKAGVQHTIGETGEWPQYLFANGNAGENKLNSSTFAFIRMNANVLEEVSGGCLRFCTNGCSQATRGYASSGFVASRSRMPGLEDTSRE